MPVSFGSLLWTTNPQKVAPADGSLVTCVTTNLATWTTTAWVKVLTAQVPTIYITGVTVTGIQHGIGQIEVEIGVGSGPTVIATIGCFYGNPEWLPLPIPYALAPGNDVWVRVAQAQFFTGITYQFSITYLEGPIDGAIVSTTQVLKCYPTRASYKNITSGGSAWTNGAWATVMPSAPADIVLAMITTSPREQLGLQNSGQSELDVGIGGTVLSTYRWSTGLSNGGGGSPGGCRVLKVWPLLNAISSGAAVQMRMRANNDQLGMSVSLMYYEKDGSTDWGAITTARPTKWFPSAADNLTFSTAAGSWLPTAYQALLTVSPVSALVAVVADLTQPLAEQEIEVGVGASPVVTGTARYNGRITTNSGNFQCLLPWKVATQLPASSDLSLRVRCGSPTAGQSIRAGIGYIESPDLEQITTAIQYTYPANSSGPFLTPGSVWVNSAWGELTPATADHILVTGLTIDATGGYIMMDLGAGPDDATTVVMATVAGYPVSTGDVYFPLVVPVYIPLGTRLSIRWRGDSASAPAASRHCSVTYIAVASTPPAVTGWCPAANDFGTALQ